MLWLAVDPQYSDLAVDGLLAFMRREVPSFRTLTINFASKTGDEAFIENGFVRQNSLIWMEVAFQASPIPIAMRLFDRLVTL